jgi:hypothetical protein
MTMPQQPPAGAATTGAGNDPLNAAARLLQQGDSRGAAALLEQAVQSDPNNGRAHQYLGIARIQSGDGIRGIASLRDASRLLPQDAVIAYNLGAALNQSGRTDEARQALERALVLDPGHQKARQALADLVRSGGVPSVTSGPSASIPAGAQVASSSGSPGLSAVGQSAPPPPAPPAAPAAPAMPTLGAVGGGGGLQPVGGGGLQPVGGGGLQPVGGGGLQPVGGAAAAPPPPPPASGGAPGLPGGMMAVGGGAYAPPPASVAPPPVLGAAGSLPASAMSAQMFSREPTSGERVQRGLMWGAIYGQIWTAVQSCFILLAFFFMQSAKHAAVGFLVAMLVTLVVAVGYAILGGIVGLIIASLGADEDQGRWIGVGTAVLLVLGNLFLGIGIFGILICGIGFFWISGVIGRLIAQKVSERVDLFA